MYEKKIDLNRTTLKNSSLFRCMNIKHYSYSYMNLKIVIIFSNFPYKPPYQLKLSFIFSSISIIKSESS